MRRVIALALAAAAAACASPTEPYRLTSPADVVLKVGQAAQVDGVLLVRLVGVPADSRCPATADCTWAGDAEVVITTSLDAGATATDSLHTTPAGNSVLTYGYAVSLVELTPYPQAPAPIPANEYAARLHVAACGCVTTTEAPAPRR